MIAEKTVIKDRRFWIPVIASLPVTVIFTTLALVTGDFGFETYVAAMIFFPFTMLSVLWFGVIPPAVGIASLFQWPVYGAIIGRAWVRGRVVTVVEVLLLIHLIAAVLAIKFIIYPDRPDSIRVIRKVEPSLK